MSTDALASLAWTGELPSSLSSLDLASGDIYSPFSLSDDVSEPSSWDSAWAVAGDYDSSTASSSPQLRAATRPRGADLKRRWTLAAAITDERLSDEALIEQLENLRLKERMWQWERRQVLSTPFSPTMTSSRSIVNHGAQVHSPIEVEIVLPKVDIPIGHNSPHVVSATWRTARRALLACRELVRTEKHYLDGLRALACCDTSTDPPPILLAYLPKLISTSQALLEKMEKNPSAQGVADAFLSLQDDIETAFVQWCAIVGSVFVDENGTPDLHEPEMKPMKRRVNSWGKRIQSLRSSPASSTVNLLAPEISMARLEKAKKPSVRELAILPTQRITRYTLLYKGNSIRSNQSLFILTDPRSDLHAHTPENSSSRTSVEAAVWSSITIAQKCDRAQENAAFL
jgi:hypothetical protein